MALETETFSEYHRNGVQAPACYRESAEATDGREGDAARDGWFAAQLLSGLLAVVEPIKDGSAVAVDGIAARNQPLRFCPTANYEAAKTFVGIEPALVLIGSVFGRLLSKYSFTFEGQAVEVDGFRIRDPERWRNYPATALESVGPISSYCNARCVFCYEQGSKLPFNARFLSVSEAQSRLAHYDVERGRGLPIGNTFSLEALCNPAALDILRAVRRRSPYELIKITTHGSNLTDEIIRGLAELKPIILVVSLNTVTADGRRKLMADHHPEVALSALPKLREARIPIIGSIVPWPSLTLDEIEATLRYFDSQQARMIRVSLPSYTRHFRPEDMFDTEEVWGGIIERVLHVRPQLATPINMMPTAYWNKDNGPIVEGTYPGSPGARAGLQVDDIIVQVGGEPVYLRHQAKRLLEKSCAAGAAVDVVVSRGGTVFETRLTPVAGSEGDHYPYKPVGYATPRDAFGIFFSDGFKLSYVQDVVRLLDTHKSRNAVVFASKLIEPVFRSTAELSSDFAIAAAQSNLTVRTAPCNYWGGNVMLGDLNVIQDFDEVIESMDTGASRPDLLILPGTFLNHRGFDLRGAHYKELGKHRIPIEIVRCDVMMK